MSESVNPYASPAVESSMVSEVPDTMEDAERIRRQYLPHEAAYSSEPRFFRLLTGKV